MSIKPGSIAILTHLISEQRNRCWYCDRLMDRVDGKTKLRATIEHRVPKARGGHGRRNKVAACLQCNSMKGPLTDLEFIALRKNQAALKKAVSYVNAVMQGAGRIEEMVCVRLALGTQGAVGVNEAVGAGDVKPVAAPLEETQVALADGE